MICIKLELISVYKEINFHNISRTRLPHRYIIIVGASPELLLLSVMTLTLIIVSLDKVSSMPIYILVHTLSVFMIMVY